MSVLERTQDIFVVVCLSPVVKGPQNIFVFVRGHPMKRVMCGHTYSKSIDQPGMVANPTRGQLNREN